MLDAEKRRQTALAAAEDAASARKTRAEDDARRRQEQVEQQAKEERQAMATAPLGHADGTAASEAMASAATAAAAAAAVTPAAAPAATAAVVAAVAAAGSCSDLADLLGRLSISNYEAVLVEEGFESVADLAGIAVDELRSIGFKLGHAKKLFLEIERVTRGGAGNAGNAGEAASSTLNAAAPTFSPPAAAVAAAAATPTTTPPKTTPAAAASPPASRQPTPTQPAVSKPADRNACAVCREPITGTAVAAIEQLFHAECFKCTSCESNLQGVGFKAEAGKPYCSLCWHVDFGLKCHKCKKPLLPDMATGTIPYITVNDEPYHKHCWACDDCAKPFGSGPTGGAYVVGARRLCHPCAHNA